MRPTPIPDDEILDQGVRKVIMPPGNDLNSPVAPVEAIINQTEFGPRFAMRIVLEDGDLERLQRGEPFWLLIYTDQLPPWALSFADPVDPES